MNAQKMDAIKFMEYWDEFSVGLNTTHYSSNSQWTIEVIDPLRAFLKTKLGENSKTYLETVARVDLGISSSGSLQGVRSMHDPDKSEPHIIPVPYPTVFDVLIEHENNLETAFQEMVKLVHLRGKLKVLITYNYGPTEGKFWEYAVVRLRNNFSTIISQAAQSFSENRLTEYLLIIGQGLEKGNVNWQFFILNSFGEQLFPKPEPNR